MPAPRYKLPHDRAIQLFTLLGGLPGVVACLILLWVGDWTPKVQWTFSTLVIGVQSPAQSRARQTITPGSPPKNVSN